MRRALLWLLVANAVLGRTPPEELFFGLSGLEQRLVFRTPLQTRSGAFLFELVEVDRLRGPSGPRYRLVIACSAAEGSRLPGDLVPLTPVYATDGVGHALSVGGGLTLGATEAWLTFVVDGVEGNTISAFAASVGPRPTDITRETEFPLEPLGEARWLAETGHGVRLALQRREEAVLDTEPDGPPYYFSFDSAVPPGDTNSPDGSYLTLRLHGLVGTEGADWRLVNLKLTGADGSVVTDWRSVRRDWRPDWGGWLGVKGVDWLAEEAGTDPASGVRIEGVVEGGPAAEAGLRPDDIIVAIDGVGVSDAYTLGDLVRRRQPGSSAKLSVWRDGRRHVFAARLGRHALWPELDEVEFRQAWEALSAVCPRPDDGRTVLNQFDWQTATRLPDEFEPHGLTLVWARPGVPAGTTFLFRDIPLTAG